MTGNQKPEYRIVDGRRYIGAEEGSYYLPNDTAEAARLGKRKQRFIQQKREPTAR